MENKYREAIKRVAQIQGKEVKELVPFVCPNNPQNIYNALKTVYPRALHKVTKPFELLGAKVEINIHCDNGHIIKL